jgi:hypothetical protein
MPEEEFDNEMTEIEQMQYDIILLEKAHANSWLVLSGQVTFEELLSNEFKMGGEAVMTFDPDEGPMDYELRNMIAYYIESEEYEKCAKLNKILEERYPQINKK